MKHEMVKKNLRKSIVIYGICFLFVCISFTPAIGTFSQSHSTVSSYSKTSMRASEGDIPTWYMGDEWTYTVDPLFFSSPNGSFDGFIENFRQTVTGITDDTYTISITGDISGNMEVSGFSGELSGVISGTSQVRVSDLAEETSELHSLGTITYMWIPFNYEMNLYMSSAPSLEVYDFPLNSGNTSSSDGAELIYRFIP